MLNIANHQGEVTPNHNISSNLLDQLLSKRQELISSSRDVEQTEPFCIFCENINWSGLYGKWHAVSSKKVKIELAVFPHLFINTKEMKSLSWSEMCTLIFTEVLVMVAQVWKKKALRHAWTNKWFKKCCTHTHNGML